MLLSNGYKHPENRLKKFEVSLKITSTNLAKKLPSQTLSQTVSHRDFQLLSQTAHVCFHEQKRVHTHLRQQDRTQRLTRRNRGDSDGGAITTLGLFHTFRKPCVARGENGKLCRFWALVGCAPEERREPTGQRCAYARRCPVGVAAPLGCVILFLLSKLWLVCHALRVFPRVRDMGGITTLGVLCMLPKRRTAACQSG